MYTGHRVTVWYDPVALTEVGTGPFLQMEALIPGIITWTRIAGSGKGAMKALRNRLPSHAYGVPPEAISIDLSGITHVWQTIPAHGTYLMSKLPPACQELSKWVTHKTSHMDGFSWLPKITDASEESLSDSISRGRSLIQQLVEKGWMTPDRAAKVSSRWYQALLPTLAAGRTGFLLRADGGTGKSVGALITALSLGFGRILILCPAEVRDPYVGWPAEIREWLTLAPYVFLPPKSPLRNKAEWPDAAAYRASRNGKPAIGVCAYNNISDHLSEIEAFDPDIIIIDEIDKIGKNSSRFRRIIVDGHVDYEKTTTELLNKTSRAAGVNEACHAPGVVMRFGMSATDIDTGDPEDIYGVLSLLDAGWGRKFDFLSRFKSGPPLEAKDPRFAERSPSNLSELKARMAAIRLDIPASVTKKFVPACDVKVIRIPIEAQGSGRGLGLAAEVKKAVKNGDSKTGFELETAMAAMAKKPYIVEKIAGRLARDQRCVAYATRIGVVEHLFEAVINQAVKGRSQSLSGLPGGVLIQDHPVAKLSAMHGIWAACIHSGDDSFPGATNKGALIAAYRDLPLDIPAFIFGSRDSISRGVNGLQETHYACYVQLGSTPGPILQAIYRHERPKKRLGMVPTEFEILVADGTVDDRISEESLRVLVAALAVAPAEGLSILLQNIKAAGQLDVEDLARRFNSPGISEEERTELLRGMQDFGGSGGLGGYDDDEDIPF